MSRLPSFTRPAPTTLQNDPKELAEDVYILLDCLLAQFTAPTIIFPAGIENLPPGSLLPEPIWTPELVIEVAPQDIRLPIKAMQLLEKAPEASKGILLRLWDRFFSTLDFTDGAIKITGKISATDILSEIQIEAKAHKEDGEVKDEKTEHQKSKADDRVIAHLRGMKVWLANMSFMPSNLFMNLHHAAFISKTHDDQALSTSRLLVLASQICDRDSLNALACDAFVSHNFVKSIRKLLEWQVLDVNYIEQSERLIYASMIVNAAGQGNLELLNVLLPFNPDIEQVKEALIIAEENLKQTNEDFPQEAKSSAIDDFLKNAPAVKEALEKHLQTRLAVVDEKSHTEEKSADSGSMAAAADEKGHAEEKSAGFDSMAAAVAVSSLLHLLQYWVQLQVQRYRQW